MIRTIVVDDEPLARLRLRTLLAEHAEFELVGEASSGRSGAQEIRQQRPDAVFLDIEMPGISGVEVARAMDYRPPPAVVFVTAYSQHAVEAFNVRALDYLLKPYDEDRFGETLDRVRTFIANRELQESHARLLSHLRESAGEDSVWRSLATDPHTTIIRIADMQLDVPARTARRRGKLIPLRPKEFDLLTELARRAGEVVDRRQLLREVWGYRDDVLSRTVDTHIGELRRKLGHKIAERGYIETVFGIGYRIRL